MDSSSHQTDAKYKVVAVSPSGKYLKLDKILTVPNDFFERLEEVERDPTWQYVRYDKTIGGAKSKTIYKGFDTVNEIKICWVKTELTEDMLENKKYVDSLIAEGNILKSLDHENIVRCFNSWIDPKKKSNNTITEFFSCGNLEEYIIDYDLHQIKAINKWARQILEGIHYLHSHDPPLVHGHIKCENIFVCKGKLKIGCLSLVDQKTFSCSSAPELFEGDYNELVDIYSFGICLLRMVSRIIPYGECSDLDEYYRKAKSNVMPEALNKVKDLQVKHFIEKCLAPVSKRPAAIDLLNDLGSIDLLKR